MYVYEGHHLVVDKFDKCVLIDVVVLRWIQQIVVTVVITACAYYIHSISDDMIRPNFARPGS